MIAGISRSSFSGTDSCSSRSAMPPRELTLPDLYAKIEEFHGNIQRLSQPTLSSSSLKGKASKELGDLIDARYQFVARHSIPNAIFNGTEVPPAVRSTFLDRLSFMANLLLDSSPGILKQLQLEGSTTFFLGAYVSADFTLSANFETTLKLLSLDSKNIVCKVSERFCALLKQFQEFSSHYSVLLEHNQKKRTAINSYLNKLWKEMCSKNPELLFPMGWIGDSDGSIFSHLFLAHVDQLHGRINLINTYPLNQQDYKNIDDKIYEQDCSISYCTKTTNHIARHLFSNMGGFARLSSKKKNAEVKMLKACMGKLGKSSQKIASKENALSKITLPFGYSCTASVYQALFQSMLKLNCEDSDHKIPQELSEYPLVWMLGLKMYVLSHFQPEVMFLGKEVFDEMIKSLLSQIEQIQTIDLKENLLFNLQLVCDEYDITPPEK